MYGSGLMGWWTIIPLTYYSLQLNTLQVGCVHLQIIKWFRFNGLVDNHPTNLIAIQLNTLQVGYVSTCRLLT